MVPNTGHRTKGPGYSFLHLSDPPTASTVEKQSPPNLWVRYRVLRQYEEPQWKTLAVHSLLCILTYPVLLAFVILASGKSLFWTRLVVGVGALLGLSLGRLVRPHLEAAVWATVIHQSKYENSPGMQLKDLALHADDPMSIWAGCTILWRKLMFPGTTRKYRARYDGRPWAGHVVFFLFLVVASGLLPFLFGRIIGIDTEIKNQHESYHEADIKGDVSDDDISKVGEVDAPFKSTQFTWTLTPYSSHGGLPPVSTLLWSTSDRSDLVYFSETIRSQLQSNGSGFGIFDSERSFISSAESQRKNSSIAMDTDTGLPPGNIIRQPKWGVRIKCEKLPDPANNLLANTPSEARTRVVLQQETITDLLDFFNMPIPADYNLPPLADDKVPAAIDKSKVLTALDFENNGVSSMYWSHPLYNMGDDDTGFVTIEMVLIRLNTTFAPQGSFPVLSDSKPDGAGNSTWIGYDAVVCVEMFEPWIVDVYNATLGALTTLEIIDKANAVKGIQGKRERIMGGPVTDPDTRRALTSKRIEPVYVVAHDNSVNQLVKDNGRDSAYVPSPNIISYTGGQGAFGYTSLSAEAFGKARAFSDANNMLPYFVGSGSLIVRVYPDLVLAFAFMDTVAMIIVLLAIFIMGLTAAPFVPRLPLEVPRRGFGLYSWLAAFRAEELVGVVEKPLGDARRYNFVNFPIEKGMDIEDIEKQVGSMRFRYIP